MAKHRLGSICRIISGSTPKTGTPEYWDGDKKWVTPAELSESDYIINDTQRKLTEAGVKAAGLTLLPEGTVILSSRAPIGKVAIAGCEMYCNQGFKNLVCSDIIFNKYLYWYLRGKTDFLNSLGRGATFKEISKSTVSEIEIDVPSYPEQMEAVHKLEKLQVILTLRRAQLAKLDELVKCRFVELFGDPIRNEKNWETVPLKSVCQQILGGGTPSKEHPEYYTGNLPWVTPKDMKTLNISDSCDHITSEAVLNSSVKLIPPFSVLMVVRSGILKHSLPVAINQVEVTINQDMKAFIPNTVISSSFLLYYFKLIERDVLSGVRAVTADNIDFKAFVKRSIILPEKHLQNKFTDFVQRIDKSRFVVKEGEKALKTLKRLGLGVNEIDRAGKIW